MMKKKFLLKDYTETISELKPQIDAIGIYQADSGDHYDFYVRPFRIYIPQAGITIRETFCTSPFPTEEDFTDPEFEFSIYYGNETDPNANVGSLYSLQELFEDISKNGKIDIETIKNYTCCFELEEDGPF